MFSDYSLGIVYRNDCEDDTYVYREWFDTEEETLRQEIATVLNQLTFWKDV